jgi:hypothetical protein
MKPQRARRNSWEKAECRNTFLIRYSVLSKVKKTKEESRRLEKAGYRGGRRITDVFPARIQTVLCVLCGSSLTLCSLK